LLSAFFASGLGACTKKVDPVAPPADLPAARACPQELGMISDGESLNKTNFVAGRGGYWYTFLDTKDNGGSEIWPLSGALGGTFEMSDGGAEGTQHHARMKGTVGGGDIAYAGMGMNFVDPKGAYDASRFGGIAFWAKKNPGSTAHVRLKVPDSQTDPDGKQCKQCFNDHGLDLELYDQWTRYTVPFKSMKQEDWGPKDGGIDAAHVYGVQFQVKERGAVFDISVDQIQFTGCG
jgi:endoglucanase